MSSVVKQRGNFFIFRACEINDLLLSYRPIYQFHISHASCKLFTSTLSKVSLILICESILFRSSNFSFSYPCDHQRTVELGHRSCVQLFTSLDESGAACLCVFLCRAAAAMWQYAYSSVTSYRRTRCQTWGLAMAGKSSGGTDTSLLFSECLIYSTC